MAYHKKTGNFYRIIGTAIDATNGRENEEMMVLYERCGKLFVRSISEFKEKFNCDNIELPDVEWYKSTAALSATERARK